MILIIHFSWYPFDTQFCDMIVKPNGNSGKFIKLVVEGLNYLGPEDLTQYFVRETKIYWKEDGTIHMIVVLGRRLLGIRYCKTIKCFDSFFRDCFDNLHPNSSFDLYFICYKFFQAILL